MCIWVQSGLDLTRHPPAFVRIRASHPAYSKTQSGPHLCGQGIVDTMYAVFCKLAHAWTKGCGLSSTTAFGKQTIIKSVDECSI